MNMLLHSLCLHCAWFAAFPAFAVQASPPQLPPEQSESTEPLYAAPTQFDRIGRILVPVMINGQGPFRLMLDTGANFSTVAPALVRALGLEASDQKPMMLNGVTGAVQVPTVLINRMQAGSLLTEDIRLPVLESALTSEAHGILGVAGLKNARIFVDFRHDRVVISRSRVRQRDDDLSDFLTIDAVRMGDGLLVVDARVHGVRAKAIIDTGSERTLGNLALRNALRRKGGKDPLPQLTQVYGATLPVSQGESHMASTIRLGDVNVNRVAITYGDFHIFRAWKLEDRPAMLIGMDVLGVADAIVIDFQRCELRVRRAAR
jgi:predicted aspartyl protease